MFDDGSCKSMCMQATVAGGTGQAKKDWRSVSARYEGVRSVRQVSAGASQRPKAGANGLSFPAQQLAKTASPKVRHLSISKSLLLAVISQFLASEGLKVDAYAGDCTEEEERLAKFLLPVCI